jgi:hypothetical protein
MRGEGEGRGRGEREQEVLGREGEERGGLLALPTIHSRRNTKRPKNGGVGSMEESFIQWTLLQSSHSMVHDLDEVDHPVGLIEGRGVVLNEGVAVALARTVAPEH